MSPDGLTEIFAVDSEPVLDRPVLVIALEGWVDAGLGATSAIASLLGQGETSGVITFNREHFLDQRARRPVAHIINGVTTELTWPQTVGLGAFPAPAPHTRPVKLAATAPPASADLVERIGIVHGELEVPAGVMSALELAFADAGIPVVSLWARVPHYVAGMPFPEASAALVEGLADIAGLSLDSAALRHAADSSRRQVDQLIADNNEHRAMVRKLEENIDASEGNAMGVDEVPTGDQIAAELEKFLRGEEQ